MNDSPIAEFIAARLDALAPKAGQRERLAALLTVSDIAYDLFRIDASAPQRLVDLCDDAAGPASRRAALPQSTDFEALRRFRRDESLRIAWRDALGIDTVEATLAQVSELAEVCLDVAIGWLKADLAVRHGVPRDAKGGAVELAVLGLGKLGGRELNFSSDIDLIYVYAEGGRSDGARPLDNEDWFARLGQQLARHMSEVSASGFVHRVDLRLRPFGQSGRVAASFAAAEQYYQREGRDWERYAWIKARPVAGDRAAGAELIGLLRPFVYRRYLDFSAIAGLREMKAMIEAEVSRRELDHDLKLGRGGIREIEFVVQLTQLVRGGREPELRVPGTLAALSAAARLGHIESEEAARLAVAYRFLRRLENRVQMLGDTQTHTLPEDAALRARLAAGLGFADTDALLEALSGQRRAVRDAFDRVFSESGPPVPPPDALTTLWRRLVEGAAGATPDGLDETSMARMEQFAQSSAVHGLSSRARARLDRLMPALLAVALDNAEAARVLPMLLDLLAVLARRSSYLALLDEHPAALRRLVDVLRRSALMAAQLTRHPVLLDELLGAPVEHEAEAMVEATLERALRLCTPGDMESGLLALHEAKAQAGFRFGLRRFDRRDSAVACARGLAFLADRLVAEVWGLAEEAMHARHGRIVVGEGSGAAVLGYGSLGGRELGFSSDLDLVFLYDPAALRHVSDGKRPLDPPSYFSRLAQKLVHLLSSPGPAGPLYEVDVRLRPEGARGLLVVSLEAFATYQRERARTWEHQALVRARWLCGAQGPRPAFEAIRRQALIAPRDSDALRADVRDMRERLRRERDRSGQGLFDLKQGHGGLVDIEFLVQWAVLGHAIDMPELLDATDTDTLLKTLGASGVLPDADVLGDAHQALLEAALACTLQGRSRLTPLQGIVAEAADSVANALRRCGLAGGD
ncbi:MAG TPA: bifunctional [glutamate--ammonia ligase]-adenylyl-L-tyrosine phosphorylase/[glutamate--ammonia-ligase] adenylyltransferase [Xanthomonadaceae bacterium]|nr:bifunctional [glutamate--ammonia ligase]-adenylyl-L-tyrosine phosphorylase/[glutamate--ammonia-ligase] adenylyltransferase [Xanthomonadaceae bacterium]